MVNARQRRSNPHKRIPLCRHVEEARDVYRNGQTLDMIRASCKKTPTSRHSATKAMSDGLWLSATEKAARMGDQTSC